MTTHPKIEILLGAGICWCEVRQAPYHDAATTPPSERSRWHAESLLKFDDRIATISEHVARHGKSLQWVLSFIRAGRTFHMAIRDGYRRKHDVPAAAQAAFERVHGGGRLTKTALRKLSKLNGR